MIATIKKGNANPMKKGKGKMKKAKRSPSSMPVTIMSNNKKFSEWIRKCYGWELCKREVLVNMKEI